VTLADNFPDAVKKQKLYEQLIPGTVLYLFCKFKPKAKDKYLFLTCTNPAPAFFVINSEINQFQQKQPDLLRCHVLLEKSKYSFLRQDSHLNCNDIINSFNIHDIETQVLKDMGRIKGALLPETVQQVIHCVENAKTLSSHDKNKIFGGLKPLIEKAGK
jgi:hypothetical protein